MLQVIDFKGVDRESYIEVVSHLLRRAPLKTVVAPFAKRYQGSTWGNWAAKSQAYVMDQLTAAQRVTMYAYSTQEYYIVLDSMRGGHQYVSDLITPTSSAMRTSSQAQWLTAAYYVLTEGAWPGTLGDTVRREWVPRFVSRSTTKLKANWAAWTVWLRARSSRFPAKLWQAIHTRVLETSWEKVCVFVHQSRILCDANLLPGAPREVVAARPTLSRFRALLPHMGEEAWRAILTQYVADMDAIIAGAPPLPSPMRVFRGVKGTGRGELHIARTHAGAASVAYTSTTLSRSVAGNYTDDKGCCVESVTLPLGAHVLPMWPISQYAVEVEVLLPRLHDVNTPT
jgi:hypothetical protein